MKRTRLAVVALCLPLLACYEEPVRDHLHIAFAPGPAIVVTAVRDIASPASAGNNPAVEDRLDEARSDLAGGWDRWGRSFASLGALAERSTIEREGFIEGEGYIERPPVSLWRSLETMVGQWLAPDLVTALVTPGPGEIQPDPDPVDFASQPRRWASAPDPSAVESELRNRLQPESLYLVRWQTRPAPDDEDEVYELALQLLATAEQDLPD